MASVILKSAGAAVGNMIMPGIGGALLGGLAGNAGHALDGLLGLGTTITGPRLENLSVQDSRYGAGIPVVYGNARVAGNVIWATDMIETQHTTVSGGKGGSSSSARTTKTYTYSLHCAVGICRGPISGITTIWADNTIVYQDGTWTSGLFDDVMIHSGDNDQAPDAFIQSILGASNVPAYKELAYVVFNNLQLERFGNRLPNLTFEIAADAVTQNPVCGGAGAAPISQKSQTVQCGSMMPIAIGRDGSSVRKVLIGGMAPSGSTASFIAAQYDVASNDPVQDHIVTGPSFASSSTIADSAWAMSMDNRFVACYCQTSLSVSHNFAIFDTLTKSFGPTLSLSMSTTSVYKQIAWIDAHRFVIDDVVGGVRGLRVFMRAGLGVIAIGFAGLWGANSGSTSAPFYGAQFTPFGDGLIAYNRVISTKTLRARTIAWRDNQLAMGDIYTIASNIDLGTGSGAHAQLLKTGHAEWTLFYGTVLYFGMLSFEPDASGAVITRPWQRTTQNYGTGTTQAPVFYGDRVLIVQKPAGGSSYLVSEAKLDANDHVLILDAKPVENIVANNNYFCAIRLDAHRFLFLGQGGTTYAFRQIAIIERHASGTLAHVVSDILYRAGYRAEDYDVSAIAQTPVQGYIVQDPSSARAAIEPLQIFAPFDLVETQGVLKAVPRDAVARTIIPPSEWRAAHEDQPQPQALSLTRAEELDLPREINIECIDPLRNFEINCQRARRIATSARAVQKISLPVVCSASAAKQIAETRLYSAWAEREMVRLYVSRAWLGVDPADVVDLGDGALLRVAAVTHNDGVIMIEGFSCLGGSMQSQALAFGGEMAGSSVTTCVPTILYVMDLPLLTSSDDQAGVYIAAAGLAGWKGASIMRSSNGADYTALTEASISAIAGLATSCLNAGSAHYMDRENTVNVQLACGELCSCSHLDLMNGRNAALLGDEIIQFQTATLTAPGLYTLSNLLRGRRGTENAVSTHVFGERFVLLQKESIEFVPDVLENRDKTFHLRALSRGQSLNEAHWQTFTYGFRTLRPFSPVHVRGLRTLGDNGDLTLTWIRRARTTAQWNDYIDVPLDEAAERYRVEILYEDEVVRLWDKIAEPHIVYTQDLQNEDWPEGVPAFFDVRIYQISARYGPGDPAKARV